MSTDLGGHNLSRSFSASGADADAPYTDTGAAATLTFDASAGVDVTEFANAINQTAGAISFDIAGPGTIEFKGDNTYSGGTTIAAGVLQVDAVDSLGSGPLTFAGASTFTYAATAAFTDAITVDSGVSATIGAKSGDTMMIEDGFADNGGAGSTLHFGSKTDTGIVELAPVTESAASAGALSIDGGTLVLANLKAASLIDGLHGGLTVGTGTTSATLDINGNTLFPAFNLSGDSEGSIINDGANTTIVVDNLANSTFGGEIGSGSGKISLDVISAAGATLTLTGDNTYAGDTEITSDSTLQVGNGGTTGSIAGEVSFADSSSKLVFDRSNAASFDGGLSGSGTLEIEKGALTLDPDFGAGFSGKVDLLGGELSIEGLDALGAAGVEFAGAANLQGAADVEVARDITLNTGSAAVIGATSGNTLKLTGALDVDATNLTLQFGSAADSGAVDLDMIPQDNFPLQIVPKVSIDGGTVVIQNAASAADLASSDGLSVGADGLSATLDLDGNALRASNLTGAGSIVDNGAATTLTEFSSVNTTFSGAIQDGSGALALNVEGTSGAVFTLTGANFFTGGVTIESGAELKVGAGGASGSITGAVSDSGALVLDRAGALHLAGIISGTGSVAIEGTGTLTLSAVNSYAGGTTLAAGTLDLAGARAAGTDAITFAGQSATLEIAKGVAPTNVINGLVAGDSFDFVGVKGTSAARNASSQLVVTNADGAVATLQLDSTASGLLFSTLANAQGTLVFVDANVAAYKAHASAFDDAPHGFAIDDTAAAIAGDFATLGATAALDLMVIANDAPVELTASTALAGAAGLAKLRDASGKAGMAAIRDSAQHVAAALGTLVSHASRIASIVFTDTTAPTLKLTAAEAKTDAPLLHKIVGRWVLDVLGAGGGWTTTGHGDKLAITAIAGKDLISGGGASETFILKKGFKQATLVDLHAHLTGAGHDIVDIASSDFKKFSAFYADAKQAGANVVVTAADGDRLTLLDMTLSTLHKASGDFNFV